MSRLNLLEFCRVLVVLLSLEALIFPNQCMFMLTTPLYLPLCFQEDLLIHGDSVYDIIDKQDHATIQAELNRNVPPQPGGSSQPNSGGAGGDSASSNGSATGGGSGGGVGGGAGGASSLEGEHRMFLCRMNVSRNARRQMRFGDQKVSTLGYPKGALICLIKLIESA